MFDPHTDCNICSTDNNQEGTNMTDFNDITNLTDSIANLREKVAELQIERDAARNQRAAQTELFNKFKRSLQQDLAGFAADNLDPSDESYRDLHEVMVDNGLEGLKRNFTVTVRVTYEFEVEVEATDEQAAQDEVDNNITEHANNHVNPGWDSPYDLDIEVEEA